MKPFVSLVWTNPVSGKSSKSTTQCGLVGPPHPSAASLSSSEKWAQQPSRRLTGLMRQAPQERAQNVVHKHTLSVHSEPGPVLSSLLAPIQLILEAEVLEPIFQVRKQRLGPVT